MLPLRSESNGQGAVEPTLTGVEESELLYRLKQHAMEELRAQRVFAALAQDFGRADAREMFSRVFLHDTSFSVDTTISYTECGDDILHLATSEDVGGTEVAPPTD